MALRRNSPPILPLDAKVLILCPIGLGNFIMATPALALLHRHLGTAHLGLLALKGGIAELGQASGWFGQIHTWDPDKQSIFHGLRLIRGIRDLGYTHTLSLFPSFHWKFGVFALAVGAGQRIGFTHPQGKPLGFLSEPFHFALPADPGLHDTDQNLKLIESVIGRRHPGPIRLNWPLPASPLAHAPKRDYVVIHPGSSAERGMAEKRLPPAAFAEWLERLYREFGLVSVLVGGPEEAELRADISARVAAAGGAEALVATPTRNLTELGGLIAGARLYLGNDSGLMHMAVALGLPCLAVFGPTDWRRTGPYGYDKRLGSEGKPGSRMRHLIVGRDDLKCRPCRTALNVGKNPACVTDDIRCLRSLSAEGAWPEIAAFVRAVLG